MVSIAERSRETLPVSSRDVSIIFGRILYMYKKKCVSRATIAISLAYKKEARETNGVSARQYMYI